MIRHTTVLFILLAGALSLILFTVKYQVQDLEHELKSLVQDIDANKRAIHVLNAEWSHLNNPARLRRLAERHLNMQPVAPDQLTRWSAFAERVPEARPESDTPVSMAAKRTPSPLFSPLADRKADR
ncbi:MAG: cell division protein FtsL [Rhodospirillales bacterium]